LLFSFIFFSYIAFWPLPIILDKISRAFIYAPYRSFVNVKRRYRHNIQAHNTIKCPTIFQRGFLTIFITVCFLSYYTGREKGSGNWELETREIGKWKGTGINNGSLYYVSEGDANIVWKSINGFILYIYMYGLVFI